MNNNQTICQIFNSVTKQIIDIGCLSKVWYRRGNVVLTDSINIEDNFAGVSAFIKKEYEIVQEYIIDLIEQLPRIDSFSKGVVNKLKVLQLAKSIGLKIPSTTIFQGEIPSLLAGDLISKPIYEMYKFEDEDGIFCTHTTEVNLEEERSKNLTYSISKVQDKIDKECDLRVFYLNGKCYACLLYTSPSPRDRG